MIDWWNSLSIISQVFYCIAIPSTLVLLIQMIMMCIGMGDDGAADTDIPDGDVDVDVDLPDADEIDGVFGSNTVSETADAFGIEGLRILTVRGIMAFLVMFGWIGVVMTDSGVPLWLTLPVATIGGFITMVILALLMKLVMKLRSDGNLDNRNAVGTAGTVYLTIPAERRGEGKVQLMLQGSYVERNAVTDDKEPITTGTEVVIIGVSGGTALIVRRK